MDNVGRQGMSFGADGHDDIRCNRWGGLALENRLNPMEQLVWRAQHPNSASIEQPI